MAQAPDMSAVCRRIAEQHPDEFRTAHNGQANGIDYVNRCAWVLKTEHDDRWGLNWKRDGNTLSQDVLTFRVGPTDRHVECIDFIVGAGGPNPSIAWNNITDFNTIGQPGTARYAAPTKPAGAGPVDPPTGVKHWNAQHSALLGKMGSSNAEGYVRRVAEQFRYSFAGEAWGLKRAGVGRPVSNEVIARELGGTLLGYRIVPATTAPAEWTLTGQVFEPVGAVNHLQVPVDPPDEPPVDPPDEPPVEPSSLAEVLAKLERLSEDVAALRDEVAAVRQQAAKGFQIKAKSRYLGDITGDIVPKD